MSKIPTHTAELPVLLKALRLPVMERLWPELATQANSEGWPHERFLHALASHEVTDQQTRRIQRNLREAQLPPAKRLSTYDFTCVPSLRRTQIESLASGGDWVARGENILILGPSGTGKSHLAAAIGTGLVEHAQRVLFTRTTDLVQKLQAARRDLSLPRMLARLDRYDCLILDDLGYAKKDHAETSVLFDLISQRYERRSLIITSNQVFGEWDSIFPDKAMTVAAIDRLVHHAVVIELVAESYRKRTALRNRANTAPAL